MSRSVLIICILHRIWAIRFFVAKLLPGNNDKKALNIQTIQNIFFQIGKKHRQIGIAEFYLNFFFILLSRPCFANVDLFSTGKSRKICSITASTFLYHSICCFVLSAEFLLFPVQGAGFRDFVQLPDKIILFFQKLKDPDPSFYSSSVRIQAALHQPRLQFANYLPNLQKNFAIDRPLRFRHI